jgi:hypothetical protein
MLLTNAISKAVTRPQKSSGIISLIPEDIETGIKEGDPFAELDKMYNVENIRKGIEKLKHRFKVAKMDGGAVPDVGHFVFVGSPGTGTHFFHHCYTYD